MGRQWWHLSSHGSLLWKEHHDSCLWQCFQQFRADEWYMPIHSSRLLFLASIAVMVWDSGHGILVMNANDVAPGWFIFSESDVAGWTVCIQLYVDLDLDVCIYVERCAPFQLDHDIQLHSLLHSSRYTKFHGLWWVSHLSFKKHISVLKTQCKEALNLMWVVAHMKWGGDRDTLLMLCWAMVCSKLDYGCIVYGTASNTNLRQLDSIHNSGLRLALGAFFTSPVPSLYTEANEAPLAGRRLQLSMHYYVKTRAFIDNPAHHALHEFDRTTRDLYAPRPNGRGGMTKPPAPPICLKVEEAMTSAEVNAELVCPLRTPNFPPGTHDNDLKRHDPSLKE